MWPFARKKRAQFQVPRNYTLLGLDDFVHSDHFVFDKYDGWITVNCKKYEHFIGRPVNELKKWYFIRPVPTQSTLPRPAETPLGRQWVQPENAVQRKMQQAIDEGNLVTELEPRGRQEHVWAPGRYDEFELTVADLDSGEAERMFKERPIWDKRHLGWVPPGTPRAVEIMYRHVLKIMAPKDKQDLYAAEGMDGVRNVALKVARKLVEQGYGELQAASAEEIQAHLGQACAPAGPLGERGPGPGPQGARGICGSGEGGPT